MAEQHGSFLRVCLTSLKHSQTNTKPSCTPRKLIGGLTQQSTQPEPQNSRMPCGEVNLGREKPQRAGSHFCRCRDDGHGGRIPEKHPSQKAAGEKVENWK